MPQRIVCSPRAVDGWLPIRRLSACLLGACVCFTTMLAGASAEEPKAGQGGETLYNGIRLPAQWPPQIRSLTLEPMSPPYLSSPPAVIRIDLGRQLFVDDFLIEDTTLRRVFHTAKYHQNNPVLKPDRPWEQAGKNKAGVNVPVAMPFSDGVWYDPRDGLFKMWYMAGWLYATCYAVSKDGIHWNKPALDVEPGTNIVHPGNRDSSTVWLDLEEKDAQRRYKMARFQKKPRRGLTIQFSPDGIHWSDVAAWAGKCNDRTTVFYNPFRKVWVYSIKGSGPVGDVEESRCRRYAEGPDLIAAARWEKYEDPQLWLAGDRLDPRSAGYPGQPQLYNLDAVAYESVLLGLFTIWQGPSDDQLGRPKRNQVFLSFSRDGFHWDRPLRHPFIGVSEGKEDWNWGNVQSAGGGCLVVGDRLYFYVSGRGASAPGSKSDGPCSTGLATLRRDGFASMDAAESAGTLTTRPVLFTGKYLLVNADASRGELRAEVLDSDGNVVAPYSRNNCVPVRSDLTLQPVNWRGVIDLSNLAGKPVKFRFYLKQGSLYSFWVSPQPSGPSHGYIAAGGPGFTGSTDTVGAAVLSH